MKSTEPEESDPISEEGDGLSPPGNTPRAPCRTARRPNPTRSKPARRKRKRRFSPLSNKTLADSLCGRGRGPGPSAHSFIRILFWLLRFWGPFVCAVFSASFWRREFYEFYLTFPKDFLFHERPTGHLAIWVVAFRSHPLHTVFFQFTEPTAKGLPHSVFWCPASAWCIFFFGFPVGSIEWLGCSSNPPGASVPGRFRSRSHPSFCFMGC